MAQKLTSQPGGQLADAEAAGLDGDAPGEALEEVLGAGVKSTGASDWLGTTLARGEPQPTTTRASAQNTAAVGRGGEKRAECWRIGTPSGDGSG
jgi:hypothetical protein